MGEHPRLRSDEETKTDHAFDAKACSERMRKVAIFAAAHPALLPSIGRILARGCIRRQRGVAALSAVVVTVVIFDVS